MRPWAFPRGISWWTIPLPAVITGRRPRDVAPVSHAVPVLHVPFENVGDRLDPPVRVPGESGRYFEGSSERKSSRSRKGSRRGASRLPKARLRWTPAPSIVGSARHTFLMVLTTVMVSLLLKYKPEGTRGSIVAARQWRTVRCHSGGIVGNLPR